MIATNPSPTVAVVGGGPGGLMVAERLAAVGVAVTVFEQMPSVGRKFLLAGRGGLNLTHSEPVERIIERYGPAAPVVGPAVAAFDNGDLRAWAHDLGEPTFVGSSGRVFPESLRATPLLRAWLDRLDALGVEIHTRHRWCGFASADSGTAIVVEGPDGERREVAVDAVVLATGGASWPRVGSDGAWREPVERAGIAVAPFRPANCGFAVAWSEVFVERFAGQPVKNVALSFGEFRARGEAMVTTSGLEGGVVYAIGAPIRDAVEAQGSAVVRLDLHPDLDRDALHRRLARRRPKDSLATVLDRTLGLAPVSVGLLREATGNRLPTDAGGLVDLVKAAPITLVGVEPVELAISTAGGIRLDELDASFMLRRRPGVFAVGEMLDWEAPTGGYLLQATFATAVAAAGGVVEWLQRG